MRVILIIILIFGFIGVKAQTSEKVVLDKNSYSMFDCKNFKRNYFIMSNSGIRYTPYGLKIGFACKTGMYVGFRYGEGKLYHSDTSLDTTNTNLFSITGGIIKPIIIKDKFNVSIQIGAGYGQWWDFLWERWTKEGYELEGGFLVAYDKVIMTLTFNMLNGYKTYATHDFSIGIGYRF